LLLRIFSDEEKINLKNGKNEKVYPDQYYRPGVVSREFRAKFAIEPEKIERQWIAKEY
jgi:hypothetical protein